MIIDHLAEVSTYEELVALRDEVADKVLAAVDVENVDHACGMFTYLGKLSEVGIAAIDMRKLKNPSADATLEDIARIIQARHSIVDKWSWVDKETCPSSKPHGWHTTQGKPHVADPYNCQFAKSRMVGTGELAISMASDFIGSMAHWNPQGSSQTSEAREVDVFFWDAHLELNTFGESDTQKHDTPQHCYLGLQKFSPILYRWHHKTAIYKQQPACKDLLQSLGLSRVTGPGRVNLHNACNYAVMELLAFLRILKMTKEEWDDWMDGENLPNITITGFGNPKAHTENRRLGEAKTAKAKAKLQAAKARAAQTKPAQVKGKGRQ